MHAGKNFKLLEAIIWTRRDLYTFFILSAIPTLLYEGLGFTCLSVPWLPIAMIGTAVAFLIGFKNNATYDRLWEARKIWGGMVNSSRTWGILSRDFVTNKHAVNPVSEVELHKMHQRLVYRHMAWLTALRYQLRQPRDWENMDKPYNVEYRRYFKVPEYEIPIEEEITKFLSAEEWALIQSKKNMAAQILAMQSAELKVLCEQGFIEDFRHMEMAAVISTLYEHQGMAERIKNFPYPRQFATLNLYFVWLFIILLPFGMLNEFSKLGDHMAWLTVPFATLVAWVFQTMERIGESSENPFQGGANDVPMAAMARNIEIDLREMLQESEIPEAHKPVNNILM